MHIMPVLGAQKRPDIIVLPVKTAVLSGATATTLHNLSATLVDSVQQGERAGRDAASAG